MLIVNPFDKHQGFSRTYRENELTLGLFFPLEAYEGSIPEMDLTRQIKLAQRAEQANFASLFVRDVPLLDPYFGDAGQMYDPWVFLGFIAAQTKHIALGTGSIVTTLRHPLDLAKSAASVDRLSNQRLLLGVATGDRPIEFDAYKVEREERSELFRESLATMKTLWQESFPQVESKRVQLKQGDLIPKPLLSTIPVFVTGRSGQSIEWIAQNSDGWISYPRSLQAQAEMIDSWRSFTPTFKPFSQSLYLDLSENPDETPTPIHLGFRSGRNYLLRFLEAMKKIGVNHVIFNFKFANRPIEDMIEELAEEVVPHFPALKY